MKKSILLIPLCIAIWLIHLTSMPITGEPTSLPTLTPTPPKIEWSSPVLSGSRTPPRKCHVAGSVLDSAGKVFPNTEVLLINKDASLPNPVRYSTTTNSEGRYYLDNIARGSYHVNLRSNVSALFSNSELLVPCSNDTPSRSLDIVALEIFFSPTPTHASTPLPSPSPASTPDGTPRPNVTPRHKPQPKGTHSSGKNIPSPTPISSPTAERSESSIEESIRQDLQPGGRLAVDAPENMYQGEEKVVIARVAGSDIGDRLTEGFENLPDPEEIKASPVMKLKLTSPDEAFKIISLNSEEQLIDPDNYTQWKWSIQALNSGEHTLHLNVVANIQTKDRGERTIDIPVANKLIKIKVDYWYLIKINISNLDLAWKAVVGAPILTAMGFFITWIRKKFTKKRESDELDIVD